MANRTNVSVPLGLSFDQRGNLAYANIVAGKDQVRINNVYDISRASHGVPAEVVLSKRPGVDENGSTFGAASQVQYLVARDPAGTWEPTPWLVVKDGTANKLVSASTNATILTNTDFQPRFWDTVNISGTENIIVQLQNTTTPSGAGNIRTYYGSVFGALTEISDPDYTGLNQRGKAEAMDGFLFQGTSNHRIYQSNVNSLALWSTNDYLTRSISQDPPQGLMKVRNQIVFLGVDMAEVFTNQGNVAGSNLSRLAYSAQRVGLGHVAGGSAGLVGKTNYYATAGDIAFFAGRYGGAGTEQCAIAYNGSRFEKISRTMEDKILSSAEVYAVTRISARGMVGIAFVFTAPTATTQRALIFFPDINDWFIWESAKFGFVNNGTHYAGSTNTQKVYTFSQGNNWQDAGANFTQTVQFRLPLPDLGFTSVPYLGLIADTTPTTENVVVSLSFNDGATWDSVGTIDLSQQRKELYACGGGREIQVRLTNTGSNETRMRKFIAALGK